MMNERLKTPETESNLCLQQKTGHCTGCNCLKIAAKRIRWRGENPEEAVEYLKQNFCPDGTDPQIEKARNPNGSHGLGQRKKENWDGLSNIRD